MIKNGRELEEIIFQQLPLVCSIHGNVYKLKFYFILFLKKANNTTAPQTKTKIRLLLKDCCFNTCSRIRRIARKLGSLKMKKE